MKSPPYYFKQWLTKEKLNLLWLQLLKELEIVLVQILFHIISPASYRYGHMIDNVVLIVTGTLHERDVHELLEKCHPLGMFDR